MATGRWIFTLALSLLFAGCGIESEKPDFIILNGAEPETLDPHIITGQPEFRLVEALFEGLYAHDPTTATAVPGVAERYEISSDHKTYIFHLRKNACWSNGDPVTAYDFVESWKRSLAPETAADYAYLLYFIKNAKAYNEGTLTDFSRVGVQAPDAQTLQVELDYPTPFFIDLTAMPGLYPVHGPTLKQYGDNWVKPGHMVSNGAYRLKDWRLNDRLDMEKNPYYWDAAHVQLKTIRALPNSQAITAFSVYSAGGADLILDKGLAPIYLLDELRKRPDFHAATFLGVFFYRFNVTRKPFDDPRIRKALAMTIDRDLIVSKITKAGERPALAFVPPGTGGYQPPEGLGYNPDQARRLLAEAGYPGGRNFPSFSILFDTRELNTAIAVEIQQMWKRELGIDCFLENQDWKVYLNTQARLDYDVSRSSWVGDYNDPNTFLDMFMSDNGNNRCGWKNAEYDRLINQANRTIDEKERFTIFRQAETILLKEGVPIAPIFYYVGINFYDPQKWGGIHPNVLDVHPFKSIYRK